MKSLLVLLANLVLGLSCPVFAADDDKEIHAPSGAIPANTLGLHYAAPVVLKHKPADQPLAINYLLSMFL